MVKSKTNYPIIIIVGIVLLVLLFNSDFFMGALQVTCRNTEKGSIPELSTYLVGVNSTLPTSMDYDLNGSMITRYRVNNGLLDGLEVINTSTCSDALFVLFNENNATYTVLNSRQILIFDTNYHWCSNNNVYMLRSDNIRLLSNYHDEFSVCSFIEVPDYILSSDECYVADGEWDSGYCWCDNNKMLINTTCEVTIIPPDNDILPIDPVPPRLEPVNNTKKYIIIGLFIILAGVLFWQFELGPDKGFIRKRGGKR